MTAAPEIFDAEAAVADIAASGARRVKCGIALRAWAVACAEWATDWEIGFLGGMAGRLIGDLSLSDRQLETLRATVAAVATRRAVHGARVEAWIDRRAAQGSRAASAARLDPAPRANPRERPVRWTPKKKG